MLSYSAHKKFPGSSSFLQDVFFLNVDVDEVKVMEKYKHASHFWGYGWREREKMIDDVMESEVRDRKKMEWKWNGRESEYHDLKNYNELVSALLSME